MYSSNICFLFKKYDHIFMVFFLEGLLKDQRYIIFYSNKILIINIRKSSVCIKKFLFDK